MKQLKPPHNSECIIAYGQGKSLQYEVTHQHPKYWTEPDSYALLNPISRPKLLWRIKPEPVVIETYGIIYDNGIVNMSFTTLKDAKDYKCGNLVIIACIKTSVLDGVVKVEVVQ